MCDRLIRMTAFLLATLAVSASPAWSNSMSIVITPDQGTPPAGTYYYSLHVSGSGTFNLGDYIEFSGMSGVTGASANGELNFAFGNYITVTDTTATFTFGYPPSIPCSSFVPPANCTSDTFPDDQGAPYDWLAIDPPAGTTTGLIDWSIVQGGVTTYSGTTEGPVAATPEPSTLVLLILGLLGLLGVTFARRKGMVRHYSPQALPRSTTERRNFELSFPSPVLSRQLTTNRCSRESAAL